MKYLRTFENYNFFDKQKFYGRTLFRGLSEEELVLFDDGNYLGNFFSESMDFASDYSDIIIEVKLKTDKVFNSLDDRNIKKLFDIGHTLIDKYKDVEYETYDDYMENWSDSDTWDIIENSSVLPWIMDNYDACLITEGGVVNYYIENINFIELVKVHRK